MPLSKRVALTDRMPASSSFLRVVSAHKPSLLHAHASRTSAENDERPKTSHSLSVYCCSACFSPKLSSRPASAARHSASLRSSTVSDEMGGVWLVEEEEEEEEEEEVGRRGGETRSGSGETRDRGGGGEKKAGETLWRAKGRGAPSAGSLDELPLSMLGDGEVRARFGATGEWVDDDDDGCAERLAGGEGS